MASASITVRRTGSGRRYVVRFRLGGRSYPIAHGGSFKTLREGSCRPACGSGVPKAGIYLSQSPARVSSSFRHAAARRL
jgi:hypothetical protein